MLRVGLTLDKRGRHHPLIHIDINWCNIKSYFIISENIEEVERSATSQGILDNRIY